MNDRLNSLSPTARQEFFEAIGRKLQSEEMKDSTSYLERVIHRVYKLKAVSNFDISAEEAGYLAVQDFLQKVEKCIDKDITPRKIINYFLPYEKKIMLDELEFDEVSQSRKQNYIDIKTAIPRRKLLGAITALVAGNTVRRMIAGKAEHSEHSDALNAKTKELRDANQAEQSSIEKLIKDLDNSETETIKTIADSREKIRRIKEEINNHLREQENDHSGLFHFIEGGSTGGLLAALLCYSVTIGMKRSELENYKGNVSLLGIGAPLNEQLIDQGLKIEIGKFQTNVDNFLMGIATAQENKKSGHDI